MHTYNIKCLIQDQITFDELWMCFQNLWDPEMVGQHGRRNLNGEFAVSVVRPEVPGAHQLGESGPRAPRR